MKLRFLAVALCVFTACGQKNDSTTELQAQDAQLKEGLWTGVIVPMHHPEQETPLSYVVTHPEEILSIAIVGPDGSLLLTRDARLDGDTLRFVFNEPEEGVELTCALGAVQGAYEGRCTDASGKWARFTMSPPAE